MPPPASSSRSGRGNGRSDGKQAQDNAAKSLASRFQALSDHLDRMSLLEDGRLLRGGGKAAVVPAGRPGEPKPPRLVAEIARFFRPVDERGIDRVVPQLVENERPLKSRGLAVTPAERAEIRGPSLPDDHGRCGRSVPGILAGGCGTSGRRRDLRCPPRRAAGILVGAREAGRGRCLHGHGRAIGAGS